MAVLLGVGLGEIRRCELDVEPVIVIRLFTHGLAWLGRATSFRIGLLLDRFLGGYLESC
jgi:hypothetical protein